MRVNNYYLTFALMLITSWASAREDVIQPQMVDIRGGEFIMGAEGQSGMGPASTPPHKVTVKPFQLSKYEVTVGEFRQFVEATSHEMADTCWIWNDGPGLIEIKPGSWNTAAYAPSEFHPVMCVSWNDARAYTQWLAEKTGRPYRLPSEAEWEFAARAGSTESYFFGSDPSLLCEYANSGDASGLAAIKRDFNVDLGAFAGESVCDDKTAYTAIVGSYKPNKFGLYDMLGNVSELVEDCEHKNFVGAPADGSAWISDCENTMKIHRGGSYSAWPAFIVISQRGHAGENNTSALGEGFRVAMDIDENPDNPDKSDPNVSKRYFERLAKARRLATEQRAAKSTLSSAN